MRAAQPGAHDHRPLFRLRRRHNATPMTPASAAARPYQVTAYCRWLLGRSISVTPPTGKPPGLGVGVGVDEDRHDLGRRTAGRRSPPSRRDPSSRRRSWPDRCRAPARTALPAAGCAPGPVTRDLAFDLALRTPGGVLEIVGHEAAIDEDEAAVGEFERRVDEEAGLALPCGEEMPLAAVEERACRGDRHVVDIAARPVERLDLGERDGRRMRARLDRGDQRFLPVQALDLPGAEREQGDEGEAAEKRDEPRKAARARERRRRSSVEPALGGLVGVLQRDEHALDEPAATAGKAPASAESRAGNAARAADRRKPPTHSARPTTTKPMISMTKMAGPSPHRRRKSRARSCRSAARP